MAERLKKYSLPVLSNFHPSLTYNNEKRPPITLLLFGRIVGIKLLQQYITLMVSYNLTCI